jgi:hypothetical protein
MPNPLTWGREQGDVAAEPQSTYIEIERVYLPSQMERTS